jgi:tRNA-splicing endonuclease subunit Sen2
MAELQHEVEEDHIPVAELLDQFLRIINAEDALKVFDMGAFGKGILQRSRPEAMNGEQKHPRRRKANSKNIAPDASLTHCSTLQLSLEEGFYLAYELYAIQIHSEGRVLAPCQAFERFCSLQRSFKHYYVAYRHFRRQGWVPKSGLKYGVDYVLYPSAAVFLATGRGHVHAPYSVIVRYPCDLRPGQSVEDSDWRPEMSWHSLQSASRLACQVVI